MSEPENQNRDAPGIPENGAAQNRDAAEAAEEARMIRIMQYCDGVLPPREAASVADEIAADPAAARLAAEISAGADAARIAWSDLEAGPVPFDLARRVTQAARVPSSAQSQDRGPGRAPGRTHGSWIGQAIDLRIAASLLIGCLVGALGLMLVERNGDQGLRLAGADQASVQQASGGERIWLPALMSALARDPENTAVAVGVSGDGKSVRIARWFDTATGQRCAEFVKAQAGAKDSGGIACRKTDGSWDLIEQDQ